MSDGIMDSVWSYIERASEQARDTEIKDLLKDLAKVLHDEEWYYSGDCGKEKYLETLCQFKEKWFKNNRTERLIEYVDDRLKYFKEELYALIGVKESNFEKRNGETK